MTDRETVSGGTAGGASAAAGRPHRARIIGLDGIRGLGCLGVAVAHVAGHYSPGLTGALKLNLIGMVLLLFFVLSGFLLFLPYLRGMVRDQDALRFPDTRQYAMHRVLRVFPAYIVIFLIVNFVFQVSYVTNPSLHPMGGEAGTGMITDPGALLANLTLLQTYIPEYFQTGINPSWSLTLEIAFYITLPLLGMLLFALRRRTTISPLKLALVAPAILLFIGYVGKLFVPAVAADENVTDPLMMDWGPNLVAVFQRSFLTNADSFAYGLLVVILFVAMEQGAINERLSRKIRTIAVVAFLPALLGSLLLLMMHSVYALSSVAFVAGIFLVIVVAPLARGEHSKLATFLDAKPLEFIGKISLSIYLWHYPVLLLLGRWGLMAGDSLTGFLRNAALVVAVSMGLAVVSYYLIEQPALNLARRYKPKPRHA
jgi:peptidoglycan/LPS O-acetylase OafA/YrhL